MSQSLHGATFFIAPSNLLAYQGACGCRPAASLPPPRCKVDLHLSQDKFQFQNNGLLSSGCVCGESSAGVNCLVSFIMFYFIP